MAPSDDILGINAMLDDTDDEEKGEGELGGEEDEDEQEHNWSSEVVLQHHALLSFHFKSDISYMINSVLLLLSSSTENKFLQGICVLNKIFCFINYIRLLCEMMPQLKKMAASSS